jgi:hypothetical protein
MDRDPPIFVTDIQDANKKLFFFEVCLITFLKVYYIIFQRNKEQQTLNNRLFWLNVETIRMVPDASQAFKVNPNPDLDTDQVPDPGFWWPKIRKITAAGEAFSPQKNIQRSKTWNFFTFLYFHGSFLPSCTRIQPTDINADPDPIKCMQNSAVYYEIPNFKGQPSVGDPDSDVFKHPGSGSVSQEVRIWILHPYPSLFS